MNRTLVAGADAGTLPEYMGFEATDRVTTGFGGSGGFPPGTISVSPFSINDASASLF